MSFTNISFILQRPQLSENIGACARAIKNFNFKKLIIINPKPIFPNDKIVATSVGAKEIIRNSKVYEDLESVVNKFDCLIATTSRFRNKNLKHIGLKAFFNYFSSVRAPISRPTPSSTLWNVENDPSETSKIMPPP